MYRPLQSEPILSRKQFAFYKLGWKQKDRILSYSKINKITYRKTWKWATLSKIGTSNCSKRKTTSESGLNRFPILTGKGHLQWLPSCFLKGQWCRRSLSKGTWEELDQLSERPLSTWEKVVSQVFKWDFSLFKVDQYKNIERTLTVLNHWPIEFSIHFSFVTNQRHCRSSIMRK